SQKMEAIGQMTGGIAHDFNNLLTVIAGNLDLAQRLMPTTPGATDQVATSGAAGRAVALLTAAQRAVARAERLTQHLLAFARRQAVQREREAGTGVVRGFLPLMRGGGGEKVEIEPLFEPVVWTVRIARSQFEAALLNLVMNARDAMPSGGRITVEPANRRI